MKERGEGRRESEGEKASNAIHNFGFVAKIKSQRPVRFKTKDYLILRSVPVSRRNSVVGHFPHDIKAVGLNTAGY